MKRALPVIGLLLALLAGAFAVPASAQQGFTWHTQFFNNTILAPPAVVTRTDTAIGFNWGLNSPANGVNADGFSARFSTSGNFSAGTYRFYVLADDGVHLYIDNYQLVINTYNQGAPGQLLTADVTLGAGNHNVQLDYVERTGDAYVYLTWSNLAYGANPPNWTVPTPSPSTGGVSTGPWTAQYYANNSLSGTPSAVVSESSPSHNWGSGAPFPSMPADNFSARWTSVQTLSGTYTMSVLADDGVRVYVDGVLKINEWHGASGLTYTVGLNLASGSHTIVIEYYEATGLALLNFSLTQTSTSPSTPSGTGNWTGQYYANTSLSGTPAAIINETSPTHNWGYGQPLASVPADYFSVRWTSVQTLGGTYTITAQADDGVRVYVDGITYIDQWHDATGQTYTATVNLAYGTHTLVVDYYEAAGVAFLNVNIQQATGSTSSGGTGGVATGYVNTGMLNFRNAPSAVTGAVIAKLPQYTNFTVVGRNADTSWWQISVSGQTGWVSAHYVVVANTGGVPVTNGTSQGNPPSAGYTVTALANVNLRTGPALNYSIASVVPRGTTVVLLGRTSDTTWWKVDYNGIVGWLSAGYASLQGGVSAAQIPVTN